MFHDIPNSLIGAIGMANKASNKASMPYRIDKFPGYDEYVLSIKGEEYTIQYIDDLIAKIVEVCESSI